MTGNKRGVQIPGFLRCKTVRGTDAFGPPRGPAWPCALHVPRKGLLNEGGASPGKTK